MPAPKNRKPRNPKPKRKWNRDIPDEILLCLSTRCWTTAESLSPTIGTTSRYLDGNPESVAIIDSYAFRFPVTHVEVLP